MDPMTVFLVERYWPGVTVEALEAAATRARDAAARMTAEGMPVRHLDSTLVSEEETVLSFFEGSSTEAVRWVNERSSFPFDRITEVLRICTREAVAGVPDEQATSGST